MKTAVAVAGAAALLLAGCASASDADSPAPTGTEAVAEAATAPQPSSTTATPATTATTATPTTSAAAGAEAPTAFPSTFTDVNQTITDSDLKQSITVKRLARQLPWPAGYKASAQAYELVALEMTWTPSKDYTIPIRKQDLAINTGSQFSNTPDPMVDDAAKAAGWTLLPDQVDKGDPVTGWVVFKVDPRNAPKMTLEYKRPAVQVSGSRTSFPTKTFTVGLVG